MLNYATSGASGADNCNKFIEILGLRTLFPLFMHTPRKHKRKGLSVEEHEGTPAGVRWGSGWGGDAAADG